MLSLKRTFVVVGTVSLMASLSALMIGCGGSGEPWADSDPEAAADVGEVAQSLASGDSDGCDDKEAAGSGIACIGQRLCGVGARSWITSTEDECLDQGGLPGNPLTAENMCGAADYVAPSAGGLSCDSGCTPDGISPDYTANSRCCASTMVLVCIPGPEVPGIPSKPQ